MIIIVTDTKITIFIDYFDHEEIKRTLDFAYFILSFQIPI